MGNRCIRDDLDGVDFKNTEVWRNSDQKPMRNRSAFERLGARRRERVTTRSCCLRRRFSATTALVPPGPRSFAIVVNRSWLLFPPLVRSGRSSRCARTDPYLHVQQRELISRPDIASGHGRHGFRVTRHSRRDVPVTCHLTTGGIKALPAGAGQVDLGPSMGRGVACVEIRGPYPRSACR